MYYEKPTFFYGKNIQELLKKSHDYVLLSASACMMSQHYICVFDQCTIQLYRIQLITIVIAGMQF